MNRSKKKEIVLYMIMIYCNGKGHEEAPCKECLSLVQYSWSRCDECASGELYCNNCVSPCYNEEMSRRMKEVMKYSGPRMIRYHPIFALQHGVDVLRRKIRGI